MFYRGFNTIQNLSIEQKSEIRKSYTITILKRLGRKNNFFLNLCKEIAILKIVNMYRVYKLKQKLKSISIH